MTPAVQLGTHEPRASVGPTRGPTGVREDGRLLTSVEQVDEAVRWMLTQAEKQGSPEIVEAEIRWARREPSRLRLTVDYEHTPSGSRVATLRTLTEVDEHGKMIERSAEDLVREARAEAHQLLHRGH